MTRSVKRYPQCAIHDLECTEPIYFLVFVQAEWLLAFKQDRSEDAFHGIVFVAFAPFFRVERRNWSLHRRRPNRCAERPRRGGQCRERGIYKYVENRKTNGSVLGSDYGKQSLATRLLALSPRFTVALCSVASQQLLFLTAPVALPSVLEATRSRRALHWRRSIEKLM